MKVVLSQVNVGSKFRFMPSGVNASLSNYPRDGWLTEAAARKWAKANGHEIVKVEKAAGKGEKIHRIEYTYTDRFGKTKKQVSELVGKDVEPLKKRIVEGLARNGDKLVSFGKITAKDGADEPSLLSRIAEKYAMDAVATKKDSPVKVSEISIKPFPAGGFIGQVYYSKNGEDHLVSPWQVKADGTWAFPFGRTSSRLTNADKKAIEQKIRKLVASKGIKVKDSADELQNDTIERVRAKYCMDAIKQFRIPQMVNYRVEIKINGQPFMPKIAVRDVAGTSKDKIAKQAMEIFKKQYWNDLHSMNKPIDKSKAKITVGDVEMKYDGPTSKWEKMR